MRVSLTINESVYSLAWANMPSTPYVLHVPRAVLLSGSTFGSLSEVCCTMSTTLEDDENAEELESLGVRADFPGSATGMRHYLGPINKTSDSSLMLRTAALPTEGDVCVTLQRQYFTERCMNAPTVSEVLLADHINAIIANDECLGSMCVTAVQNKVIKFPFYDLAMLQHGTTCPFTKFIKRFDVILGYWKVFRYADVDRRQFPTFSFDLDGVRITTIALFESREYFTNDLARERIHYRAQLEIRSELDRLRNSGITFDAMVKELGESRSFRTLREVQCTRLMRNYAALGDRGVVHHPRHALMVVMGAGADNRFAIF